MLKYFCKSIIEGRKIQIDDLKEIDDEVVDIDIQKLRSLFSDDAWSEVLRRGMYLAFTVSLDLLHWLMILLHIFIKFTILIVDDRTKEWMCHFCDTATLLKNMIMCDRCLLWFHWYVFF